MIILRKRGCRLAAQARPGSSVSFEAVSVEEAQRLLREYESQFNGSNRYGNASDKTWYPKVVEALERVFSPGSLKEMIFVADSALVALDNLKLFAQKEFRFISRLPQTFAVTDAVKEEAHQEREWIEAGVLAERKGAASCRVKEHLREINSRPYRLIVVHVNNHGSEVIKVLSLAGFNKEIYLQPSCASG